MKLKPCNERIFAQGVTYGLNGLVEEISKDPSDFVVNPGVDFTRVRKLTFFHMLYIFLLMGCGVISSGMRDYFKNIPLDIPSKSAFIQARAKILPEVFHKLLSLFNAAFPMTQTLDLSLLNGFTPNESTPHEFRILAIDGTDIEISHNPDDPLTYHPPRKGDERGYNSIHTTVLYDPINKIFLDSVTQPEKEKNEYAAACELINNYDFSLSPSPDILTADRGFCSYNTLYTFDARGLYYVVRGKDTNAGGILGTSFLDDELDVTKKLILSRTSSKKKIQHPELADQYRTIAKNVRFDFFTEDQPECELTVRVVRFQLESGEYENLITNLPADLYPVEVLKQIYFIRWGIETAFRDLKHILGDENFHSKNWKYVEEELTSRMIMYNYTAVITSKIEVTKKGRKYDYKINMAEAFKICKDLFAGKITPGNAELEISKHLTAIRPGRSFKRRPKGHMPPTFNYRCA